MDLFELAIGLLVFLLLSSISVTVVLTLQLKNKMVQYMIIGGLLLMSIVISLLITSLVSGPSASKNIPEAF